MHKIAVHCNTILIGIKVYPIWLCINYTVTLLQKENIARDLCACVRSESVVGQSDSSEQLGSLSNILLAQGKIITAPYGRTTIELLIGVPVANIVPRLPVISSR